MTETCPRCGSEEVFIYGDNESHKAWCGNCGFRFYITYDLPMKRVYVAHPYGGKEENRQRVEAVIRRLVKENPDSLYISPIHALGFLYKDVEYEQGMKYCLELLRTCDELYLCKGWETSRGCNMEKPFAEEHGIPIVKE